MSIRLKKFAYLLSSCGAGIWESWCLKHGNALMLIPLGLPLALISYAYVSPKRRRSAWKPLLVTWLGMPIAILAASLTMLAETGVMRALGFSINDLPYLSLRLLIGEGAACLLWARCLLSWHGDGRPLNTGRDVVIVFAILYGGVAFADGLSMSISRATSKNPYFLLTSIFATIISAWVITRITKVQYDAGPRTAA